MIEPDYEELLRDHGLRVTPQRSVIIRAIWKHGEHAEIEAVLEEVHQHAPNISPATVYRTLDAFIKRNLVVASKIGAKTVYEIVDGAAHYHLICRNCGWDQRVELKPMKQLIKQIGREFEFQVEPEHMILTGICGHCREQMSQEES